jgi:molybdate transport system substrate-binding protein
MYISRRTLAPCVIAVGAAILIASPKPASADEVRALMTIGVQSALEDLIPRWEKSSGNKLNAVFGLSAALSKRISDGEQADVFIGTREGVDGLIKAGKLAGPGVVLASSGVGIAVRKGKTKPDVSTPEALKRTLLAARAVSYLNPADRGASSLIFVRAIERLGIVDAITAKAKFPPAGISTGQMLLTGEADLAVQQIPELLSVEGVDIAGPLPGDLQTITVFATSVPMNAKDAAIANRFVAYLRSSEALAVFKARGLDPQ